MSTTVEWLPGEPLPAIDMSRPVNGADKYYGTVASGYDAKRESNPKWEAEQRIIESMLDGLPQGAWVLDCPVGTGRFLQAFIDRKYQVWAFDKSTDMLMRAQAKLPAQVVHRNIRFGQADVRSLPLADGSVDLAVMCRLTRWLSPEDCTVAIHELARVTRKRIIFTARVANHPHARPYGLFAVDGWQIVRDEQTGDDEDLRVICVEPAPAE